MRSRVPADPGVASAHLYTPSSAPVTVMSASHSLGVSAPTAAIAQAAPAIFTEDVGGAAKLAPVGVLPVPPGHGRARLTRRAGAPPGRHFVRHGESRARSPRRHSPHGVDLRDPRVIRGGSCGGVDCAADDHAAATGLETTSSGPGRCTLGAAACRGVFDGSHERAADVRDTTDGSLKDRGAAGAGETSVEAPPACVCGGDRAGARSVRSSAPPPKHTAAPVSRSQFAQCAPVLVKRAVTAVAVILMPTTLAGFGRHEPANGGADVLRLPPISH